MATLHVGFDDTDSPRKGCTTYIAALLVEKLEKLNVEFIDYPNLIRLNPNVPWKTRGNGALCIRIKCNNSMIDTVFDTMANTVEQNSDLGFRNTDPGIVFFQGDEIPQEIQVFAKKTIQSIVTLEEALRLVKKHKAEALGFGMGYGIVGALAAIGETLEGDHTYEIIAYRTPENRGLPRRINLASVREMDRKTMSDTFNNVDYETQRVLITPRGPDPILYGVRGETPEAVVLASKLVQSIEPVERWVVFRTNHGTDAHLKKVKSISNIQPYHPVVVTGTVASMPKLVPRRHRIFTVMDDTGKIDCAAYEPTGTLRKTVRQLVPKDLVEVYGGVKPVTSEHFLTVNLEKLHILKLAPKLIAHNPECLRCGKRMSSMGRGQGFKCKKCGYRTLDAKKTIIKVERDIKEGLFITSPRSQRHLTKPMKRYGKEKNRKPEKMVPCWHYP